MKYTKKEEKNGEIVQKVIKQQISVNLKYYKHHYYQVIGIIAKKKDLDKIKTKTLKIKLLNNKKEILLDNSFVPKYIIHGNGNISKMICWAKPIKN